ncbi:MAG: putative membrane-associated protein [Rhodobacteraceae bacterium HLUCCA12]|nr:MAG: putative membrane-associated protein [Rhodobacteraceae bacterium HLUCCA12]
MSETLFALVSDWGAAALMVATFLSCLAMPVPTSLMMLAAGAFVASGDMAGSAVVLGALAGAVAGDQTGYGLGRAGGKALTRRLRRNPARQSVLIRAERAMARRGSIAVFLSRWLFSPLGPYVNLIAGAATMGWWRFTLASVTGEAVWVALYVGLGAAFGNQLSLVASVLSNSVGLMSAAAVAVVLGALVWRRRPAFSPRRVPPA